MFNMRFCLIETEHKKFIVFNYKRAINKSFYFPDSDNGNSPWFYEPPNYNGKKPYSLGYKSKDDCMLDAHIDECNQLIKIYEQKLKIIISFFDTLTELETTRCIGKTTQRDVDMLELSYSSSMFLMKKLQHELKNLKKRRTQLKEIENNKTY